MIEGRNIVCIASGWDEHPTCKQHVMRALSRGNDIIWVNYHASRRPRLVAADLRSIVDRLRRTAAGPKQADGHIHVLSPPLVPIPESGAARRLNSWQIRRSVSRALRRLPPRPVQLWLFTPDAPEVLEHRDWERVVYYCVDEFSAFEGFNAKLIEKLEQRTLERADVVIATSQPLFESRSLQHDHVHFVAHGVDVEHFGQATRLGRGDVPHELARLRGPVLGYFGQISEYVDLELIAEAARRRRDWNFVLIGPLRCAAGAVDGISNVHLLGGRPYASLPAYCAAFDVGLIPFRMNELTHAVNPIKLREYLAAGLPVVSAPMPEVRRYVPAVRTARTVDEFIPACEAALRAAREIPGRRRQALVRGESWDARVEQLSKIVLSSLGAAADSADARRALRTKEQSVLT